MRISDWSSDVCSSDLGSTQTAVEEVIAGLERGELRVASPGRGVQWQVHQWLKKAVLLYFRVNDMQMMDGQPAPYYDKVPLRFADGDESIFREVGRSEERRVGKACVSPCRSRWSPYH